MHVYISRGLGLLRLLGAFRYRSLISYASTLIFLVKVGAFMSEVKMVHSTLVNFNFFLYKFVRPGDD